MDPDNMTVNLIVRLEAQTKVKLKAAAERAGETMSTFATKALIQRAERVLSRSQGSLPTCFRALAARAAAGGPGGWRTVGRAFAGICVNDLDTRVAENAVRALETGITRAPTSAGLRERGLGAEEGAFLLAWLDQYFSRYLSQVPVRRRSAFVSGFIEQARNGGTKALPTSPRT